MSLLPSFYAVDATRYRVSARLTGRSPRREDAIENALKAKLQARAAQRRAQEMMARQAAKELEEFTNEFKNAARHCFELIDVDKGGSLSKEEIVNAVHPKTGIEARTRRPTTARTSTCEDSVICGGTAVFVCLVCGGAESDDSSNYEHTHTQRNNRTTASHFAPFAESHQVPQDVRRGEPAIFAPPAAAAEGLGDPGHG